MKVIVAGAGQMGSLYGAAFLENGNEVWLFDYNGALVDAINANGLVMDRRDGRSDTYRVRATTDPSSLGITADLVLFMVKGYGTRESAEKVRPAVDGHTVLLTLQNGLGNEEVLRELYPDNELLIGMSVHTVTTIGLGHYSHTGVRETYLGPSRGESLDRAREVAAAMETESFPVKVLPEEGVRTERWGKFALNCATLPVSALTRLDIDVLKDQAPAVALMDEIMRETCGLARAEGIELDADERVAFLHDVLARAGGRASMLGDVFAKRRTEIETINGAAIMYADRHGLAAPLNRAMYALVKGLDKAIEVGSA